MRLRNVLLALVAVILVAGAGFAGWRIVQERQAHMCAACRRAVHDHTMTIALVKGKQTKFCCPACAMSQLQQTGVAVKLVSVADFDSGARLTPDRAFFVRGSDVNSCAHNTAAVDMDKQPMEPHFDRCSPSMLAFADKGRAESFAREHGGQVLAYADAAALFR